MRNIARLVFVLALLLMTVIPAFAQERPSVLEILENDADGRFTTLVAAIDAAGLRETLEGEGPFTILAPTNDAFQTALDAMGLTPEDALALGEPLQMVLLKHVIPGQYFFRNLTGGPTLETVGGETVTFDLTDGVFTVNGVGISDPDQLGSNGIVHAIDGVLLPDMLAGMVGQATEEPAPEETPVAEAPSRPTLGELLAADADGRFTTLLAAVEAAGLTDALSAEGPLTVLAPTNDAFAEALAYLGMSAEDLLADTDTLTAVLAYHVIPGQYFFRNLTAGPELETLNGATVDFDLSDGFFSVNGVGISDPDQLASNGIFHVIDGVLLPPAIAEAVAANRANVRFVHASPDFGSADLYANGLVQAEGVGFGGATEWMDVAAGTFDIGVAPAGGEAASIGSGEVAPGSWVTVVVLGSADAGTARVQFVTEDYSEVASDRARVSVMHAVENLGAVDVLVNGDLLIGALYYPGANGDNDGVDTRDIPAGVYNVTVNGAGTSNVAVDAGNVRFNGGSNYLVIAGGVPGGVQFIVLETAAAPAE